MNTSDIRNLNSGQWIYSGYSIGYRCYGFDVTLGWRASNSLRDREKLCSAQN
jgi:hypothetical protein